MKNQFILNPSMEFIEETSKVFSTPDGFVCILEDDILEIMYGASNALLLESIEASGSGRTDKIINDINSFFNATDSFDINNIANIIIRIEYPTNDELTIDEVDKIFNAISNLTSPCGVIWGATPVERDTLKIKFIFTNIETA